MTAVAQPPAGQGQPAGAPAPATNRARPGPGVALRPGRRRILSRIRVALGSTAGRYRLWSVAAALFLLAGAVVAAAAATHMRSSTRRAAANSGPVLVATQQLVSSLAEADAAATAAFLSGRDEDPEQRRLYEQALARSSQQLERIAALVGDDPAVHDAIQRVSVQVTRYAGLVEAARVTNKAGGTEATGLLTQGVRLVDQIVRGDVAGLTTSTQERLEDDVDGRGSLLPVAVLALVAGLVLLLVAQWAMTKSSRRLLNIPLAVATILVLATVVTLVRADRRAADDQGDARTQGYDSVALTVRLATAGFGTKASETLALISGSATDRRTAGQRAAEVATSTVTPAAVDALRAGQPPGVGGLLEDAGAAAGSPRERAAVAEAAQRWQRYRDTVGGGSSATPAAVAASGAAFNGFNFSVESVLGQNRAQFLDGLDDAAKTAAGLPVTLLVLMGAALLAMFWGFQLRIDDYR